MADQMWTNCADVRIVSSTSTTAEDIFSSHGSASSDPECPTVPTSQPAAPSPPTTKAPSPPTTKAPTPAPSPTPDCMDFKLTGNWGATGTTCNYYEEHGGLTYCAHTVIDEACCFCGGGGPPVPTMALAPCTDFPLSGNWGASGFTCDYYEGHSK